jgi:hypothetical protein
MLSRWRPLFCQYSSTKYEQNQSKCDIFQDSKEDCHTENMTSFSGWSLDPQAAGNYTVTQTHRRQAH